MRTTLFIVALLSFLLVAGTGHGQTVAASTTNSGSPGCCGVFALGWQFTVNTPMTVTALGRLDSEEDAVFPASTARLFNWDTGAPLVTTTVTPGGAEVDGNHTFHYASTAPTLLVPGTNYLVAVEVTANDYVFDVGITLPAEVNYVTGRATIQGGSGIMPAVANTSASSFSIVRPGTPAAASYFGANFKFFPLGWVVGGFVDTFDGILGFTADGPVIFGNHFDGATTAPLPGPFSEILTGGGGDTLPLGPFVSPPSPPYASFSQTLNTVTPPYTSVFTLDANYSTSAGTFQLGIPAPGIELNQTNGGAPASAATVEFWLVIPWRYQTATGGPVNLTGVYSFDVNSSKSSFTASDSFSVEACRSTGERIAFAPSASLCTIDPEFTYLGGLTAPPLGTPPFSFSGTLSGTLASNTRYTHFSHFSMAIENGAPEDEITISNFQFTMTAEQSVNLPSMQPVGYALLLLCVVGSAIAAERLRRSRYRSA